MVILTIILHLEFCNYLGSLLVIRIHLKKVTFSLKQILTDLTGIRNSSVGHQLGEKDAEAPDVGLDGELGVVRGFGGSPLDRESGTDSGLVFVLFD
jgi:hypothetical protein